MTPETKSKLILGLKEAFDGRNLCAQSWLGYADRLFVGFGTRILPPVPPEGRHPHPTFEIQTRLAHWTVYQDSRVVGSSHDDPDAQAACDLLVGKTAVGFRFLPDPRSLRILLSEGVEIGLMPYTPSEARSEIFAIWCLRLPGGRYLTVRNDQSVMEED